MTDVHIPLRAVVFREEAGWVAQCLEYDIFACAPDFDTLVARFQATLDAEAKLAPPESSHPFAHLPTAPAYFQILWEQQKTVLQSVDGIELAIAA